MGTGYYGTHLFVPLYPRHIQTTLHVHQYIATQPHHIMVQHLYTVHMYLHTAKNTQEDTACQ